MNILIIDDEKIFADLLVEKMERSGFHARAAYTGTDGLDTAELTKPDIILCDLNLPDIGGLELLPKFSKHLPDAKVIVMTGGGCTADAVAAMKLGAEDYLEKPFNLEELMAAVKKMDHEGSTAMVSDSRKKSGTRGALDRLKVHMGPGMEKVYDDLSLAAAQQNVSVLLLGETGSGKEHAARLLHQLSERHAGPLIEVNCASIPESLIESEFFGAEAGSYTDAQKRHVGLFEAAQGGTLFLDEVGELSQAAQAKLLKILETRELRRLGSTDSIHLNLRLVAATNKNLEAEAHANRFRFDLFYRLSLFTVRLPSLRERRADIPDLARFLFDQACKNFERPLAPLSEDTLAELSTRDWPGNVRELRNLIEGAVLRARDGRVEMHSTDLGTAEPTHPADFPVKKQNLRPFREAVDDAVREVKRNLLIQALRKSNGNNAAAARLLDVDTKTVTNLQKSLHLNDYQEEAL